ncbi:riboflavin synthase [Aureibacillus halotolerans]|uniref:Riboflavin synthase n=1 Tax=Aureibacillus halotolerans TaxID=1508390 RepID=A0A4R6U523_9BACI|nr:riboflavin synthase [Aureibacillus halotolerans]TDQ41590.1 riboflavin synthase alpha chain [Aureibacillus halotolerans]
MFTGIIEEIGHVLHLTKETHSCSLTIAANTVLTETELGDSISVNGVCLTVIEIMDTSFTVDVMPETLKATTIGALVSGAHVNLERAMSAKGRFGGHFVSGHVDGVGTIVDVTPESNATYVKIALPDDLAKYMALKGSVAIDGTSLTLFGADDTTILLSLIPHTSEYTVLGRKKRGDSVNIEADMLMKYTEKLLQFPVTHKEVEIEA